MFISQLENGGLTLSLTSVDDVTSLQAQLDRKERELKAKVRNVNCCVLCLLML